MLLSGEESGHCTSMAEATCPAGACGESGAGGAVLGLPPSCPSPVVSAQGARSVLFLDVTHSNTRAEKSESTAAQKALI